MLYHCSVFRKYFFCFDLCKRTLRYAQKKNNCRCIKQRRSIFEILENKNIFIKNLKLVIEYVLEIARNRKNIFPSQPMYEKTKIRFPISKW